MADHDNTRESGAPKQEERASITHKWKRPALYIGVVLAVAPILLFVIYKIINGNTDTAGNIVSNIDGYENFPLNVSYEPGDIVAIDSNGQISALLVGRDVFSAVDSMSVRLSKEQNVPSYIIERRNEFASHITASAPKDMQTQLRSAVSSAEYIHQRVNTGYNIRLRNGASVASSMLKNLPNGILEDLYNRQERGDSLIMISNTLVYADASLEAKWGTSLSSEMQAMIGRAANIGGKGQWIGGEKYLIKYEDPISVGFKAISVARVDPNWADLLPWYRDSDGDGYGRASSEPVRALEQPKGYALASGDCLDTAGSVHPGQRGWFSTTYLTSEGRPSWDYNCNGQLEKRWTIMQGGCRGNGQANQGWVGNTPPECGEARRWLSDCDRRLFETVREYQTRRQECR